MFDILWDMSPSWPLPLLHRNSPETVLEKNIITSLTSLAQELIQLSNTAFLTEILLSFYRLQFNLITTVPPSP